jgi:hypothetical protein
MASSGSPYNVTVGQDVNDDSVLNDRPALAPNPTGECMSLTAACHYALPTGTYTPIPINYLTGPGNVSVNLRLAKTFNFGPEKTVKTQDTGPGGPPGSFGGMGRGPGGGPGGGGGGRGGMGGGPPGGGPGGGGPGGPFGGGQGKRRYSLTFSVSARNLINHVNPANPIGNLGACPDYPAEGCVFSAATSLNFGHSISLGGGGGPGPGGGAAANRKIELQAMFSF